MITLDKLKIYKKYNGDVDMWARMGDQQLVSDKEWSLISSLIQDLIIVQSGSVSDEYVANLNDKFKEEFDNDDTVNFLKAISNIALKP